MWNKIVAHPSYDAFWRDQAMDKLLAKEPLAVPVLLVHSLWDPAKPVPFRARPIQPPSFESNQRWVDWLVTDQREASGRTDVATFTSDVVTQPIQIAGSPIANLVASTSGSDADWAVKLIDVYPDEVASDPRWAATSS